VGQKRTRAHKWLEGLLLLLFASVLVLVASGLDGEATPSNSESTQRTGTSAVPTVSTSLRPVHSVEWEKGQDVKVSPTFP